MAAQVLGEEAGVRSETLAKFLYEREARHLADDPRPPQRRDPRETGMARTDDLAKLLAAVEQRTPSSCRLGNPHQLGAVGPGGIFRTLVADHGAARAGNRRRFHHAWEAAASLRLREGNRRSRRLRPHDRIASGAASR